MKDILVTFEMEVFSYLQGWFISISSLKEDIYF